MKTYTLIEMRKGIDGTYRYVSSKTIIEDEHSGSKPKESHSSTINDTNDLFYQTYFRNMYGQFGNSL